MSHTLSKRGLSFTDTMLIGVLLLAGGIALNYFLGRASTFTVWENPRYPVTGLDLVYPSLCVFLLLTGAIFVVGGLLRRGIFALRSYVFSIAIPLTLIYVLFAFAMQFIQTGADRLGECAGLDEAALTYSLIPESPWAPGHPAVGCALERRGIFLSYYNSVSIYGVSDPSSQERILAGITEHFRDAHTHPVRVMFYGEANSEVRRQKNGATFGSRGSTKLIRVANIG